MRDAFGGAFMIQVFLVFILIYICFTAMALNYAKAFKVKNTVVEYLESNEIVSLNSLTASQMDAMDEYFDTEVLGNLNYNLSDQGKDICKNVKIKDYTGKVVAYCHDSGIVIEQSGKGENTEGVYYTVSTYVGWSTPFLNKLLALNGNNKQQDVPVGMWKISGQTRLIVNG